MTKDKNTTTQKNELNSWLKCIVVAVVLGLVLRFFVVEFVKVSGSSMSPGLHTGQIVLVEKVSRHFSDPDYDDVVVVKFSNVDERYYIKRVIGLPGDTLEIKDGSVYRNGELLNEPYLLEDYIDQPMELTTVPADHIFVMGDNRNDSTDSRSPFVGAIPEKDYIGHGLCVILPLDEIKSIS